VAQVPVNASNRTTEVYGGIEDPHNAMLGGHSTLNTVVLGEGMSKYQITPTLATIAAQRLDRILKNISPGTPDAACKKFTCFSGLFPS
jgi:hypothetical protein